MQYARPSLIVVLFCTLLPVSCIKRVKSAGLKSPYQCALDSYYQAIDRSPPEFSAALVITNALVAKNPADLEVRSLRTQIYLQTLHPLDAKSRTPLLKDVTEIVDGVGPPGAAWVRPRAFLTAGDLFVLVGNSLDIRMNAAGEEFNRLDAFRAFELFDAARSFYGLVAVMVDASKGNANSLQHESENARDGYTQATEGALNALSFIDPLSKQRSTKDRRQELLADMKRLFDTGSVGPPTPGVASLRVRNHEAQRRLYTQLAVAARASLKEWCANHASDPAATKAGEALLSSWLGARKRALLHAELELLLDPNAENDESEAQAAELAYNNAQFPDACILP